MSEFMISMHLEYDSIRFLFSTTVSQFLVQLEISLPFFFGGLSPIDNL